MTPALISSVLNCPIAATSSWVGGAPASEFLVALTITMTRMSLLLTEPPDRCGPVASRFCEYVERRAPKSTRSPHAAARRVGSAWDGRITRGEAPARERRPGTAGGARAAAA